MYCRPSITYCSKIFFSSRSYGIGSSGKACTMYQLFVLEFSFMEPTTLTVLQKCGKSLQFVVSLI